MSMAETVPQGGQPEGSEEGYRTPFEQMRPEQIVQMNNAWYERSVGNRAHVEKQSLLSLAFFLGQQYVGLPEGPIGNSLVSKPKPKGRVRTTENIISPAYRNERARLLRTRPTGVTLPLSDDPEDIEAAQAADDVLQHLRREHDLESFTEAAVDWALIAGDGHLSIAYDESKVDRYGNQGDLDYRVLSPFEFAVPRLREPILDKQPYVMVTKMYEIEEIEDRWGVKVSPDSDAIAASLEDRLTSIVQGTMHADPSQAWAMTGARAQKNPPKSAVVKETWVKPSERAPFGAVIITAGGQLLEMTPWPTWCRGLYPFAKYTYTKVPGSYWGRGFISDLIPVQRRHNRANSIVVEVMNLYSMLAVAAPKNTKVQGMMGGRGLLLETPLGATQSALNIQPPPVGDLPFRELDNTRRAFRDISSQHEVSQGTTPPNVRSGTAINLLKEIDDAASTMALRSIERAEERLGRHALEIVRENWDEQRMVLIVGDDGDIERRSFLRGQDVSGHYVVQAGSAWPYAKAEKQNSVMQLWESGLLDPREALQHLDLGVTSATILKGRNEDRRHARRENQKFEDLTTVTEDGMVNLEVILNQARAIAPESWHNHQAHLEEHNRLRKSPRYERWPVLKKMLFQAHIEGHMLAFEQQMAAQMMAQGGVQRQGNEGVSGV